MGHDKNIDVLNEQRFEENIQRTIGRQELCAKAVRGYFVALVKSGFSEEQAMDITQMHGICPPNSDFFEE